MTPNAYHRIHKGEELLPLDLALYTLVYFCPYFPGTPSATQPKPKLKTFLRHRRSPTVRNLEESIDVRDCKIEGQNRGEMSPARRMCNG